MTPRSTADPVLADSLDTLRRSAGLSFRELARRTNRPASTLNDALRGRRFPKLDTVLAVAEACGANPADWRERWRVALGRRLP